MAHIESARSLTVAGITLQLLLTLSACNGDGNNSPMVQLRTPGTPTLEGPVTGGGADDCCILDFFGVIVDLRTQGYTPGTPFYAGVLFDEAEVGYQEKEYFFSGTAISYTATGELGADGIWNIEPAATADYKSRIVVQRPANAADFNGTVVMEWFNVTGGLDAAPDWIPMHTELMREGYVWVGVSAQSVGIEGGGPIDIPLKKIDEERYGSLHHPGDSFSYDIFSQAAQAVRHPVGLDPLQGLRVQRMIAVGESQSAARLVTYFNAVQPTVDLFDGFIIHSRGSGSAVLSQLPQAEVETPDTVYLRTDLPRPVIVLQTETDIFSLDSVASRQPDTAALRLWEVAGTSHADNYTSNQKGQLDRGGDPTVADVESNSAARAPFIYCDLPINDGPGHWVASAAIAAMDRWLRTGDAAPHAPLLALDGSGTGFELDELGNVKGGIRTPYVDAPVAVLSGEGQPPSNSFCRLYGTTALFDANTLATLYPDKATYVNAIDTATDAAVAGGFLVPADADLIKERARTSSIGSP
jgi:hypothetical protein